jgi:hypothetical protein
LTFICTCIASILVNLKFNQQDATFFLSIYFYKLHNMFQAVSPSIIRSTKLYIQVFSNEYCCLLLSWIRWYFSISKKVNSPCIKFLGNFTKLICSVTFPYVCSLVVELPTFQCITTSVSDDNKQYLLHFSAAVVIRNCAWFIVLA